MDEYSTTKQRCSILICGAGITGLTLARELLLQGHDGIIIIDKEPFPGKHASGLNSGILHAGIYYTPDTLKAQFCLEGNRLMKEYCKQNSLPLYNSGKVIVARTKKEIPVLHELYIRARQNGTSISLVGEKKLTVIEPHARTTGEALYTPETATIDPKTVLKALFHEVSQTNRCTVLFNTRLKSISGLTAITASGTITCDLFINAAGAHADRVARTCNTARNYTLIPFKGTYRKLSAPYSALVRGNIYPVPDIRNPFLGVHLSKNIHGEIYVGPTAIPAFGRENYGLFKGIDTECFKILLYDALLFFTNRKFRTVALREPKKYFNRFFYNDARGLVDRLDYRAIIPSGKTGIRPQLVDLKKRELVMDFLVKKEHNRVHLLNTISPAFTSSMAFAKMVVKQFI